MLCGKCYTLLSSSFRSFLRPPYATPFLFFPDNLLSSQPIFLPQVNTRISTYNTNCLKLIPSWEKGTLSAFYGHRKFHNRPPLATVLRQTNPFHSFDFCILRSILMLSALHKVLQLVFYLQLSSPKPFNCFSCTPCLPHFLPITVSLFCYCNNIW